MDYNRTDSDKISVAIKSELMGQVFGKLDENMKKIEKNLSVTIVNRGEEIKIIGEKNNINKAAEIIRHLASMCEKGEVLTSQRIDYMIDMSEGKSQTLEKDLSEFSNLNDNVLCVSITGRPIFPKTLGQKQYIEAIKKNTIVFGVGPAGTGKTFLAMALAITAFKNNSVNRIILTRPAIEAGEKLGFLPGDLQQKVDPYLRPLYDALHEIMGAESFQKNVEKGLIEVAPLAYMRGRTLDNAFIVLDEAQNTTPEQMKMFLTRIGFGSKAVVTGDITQIDLPPDKTSGLKDAMKVLKDIDDIATVTFTERDVVRHPLIQRIIKAYERSNKR